MPARSLSQILAEFVTTLADRFGMHSRDLRNSLESAMPQTHCLAGRHRATLLLVETAQQHIQLPMVISLGVLTRTTIRTTALVN